MIQSDIIPQNRPPAKKACISFASKRTQARWLRWDCRARIRTGGVLFTEEIMAFNNVGPLTFLAPGQTAFWSYTYGADHGTQFASADVKTPNQGAVHLADQQGKSKDNNGNATYFVAIHNRGVGGCFHNLQGGGMS